MERQIIKINQEKCVGCRLCVDACSQDALQLIDGKATLVDDSYCDGLGMCLPQCPVDAIEVIVADTVPFNKKKSNVKIKTRSTESQLNQWPIQLHLVRENADFFKQSNLLIAADCVPFTFANFHETLLADKSLVMACPKLDETSSYVGKLAKIFQNEIKSITLVIMEVPCCSGLRRIVEAALELSGREIPVRELIVSLHGEILN